MIIRITDFYRKYPKAFDVRYFVLYGRPNPIPKYKKNQVDTLRSLGSPFYSIQNYNIQPNNNQSNLLNFSDKQVKYRKEQNSKIIFKIRKNRNNKY